MFRNPSAGHEWCLAGHFVGIKVFGVFHQMVWSYWTQVYQVSAPPLNHLTETSKPSRACCCAIWPGRCVYCFFGGCFAYLLVD
jgi:hypothetical protein